MRTKSIHPFPARMAPELAVAGLRRIRRGSVVLDPMAGSGTVIRHASELGHHALGFDLDPLAVLMTKVSTTFVADTVLDWSVKRLTEIVNDLPSAVYLPWIDDDDETDRYINYWFAERQRLDLRRLAFALSELGGERLSLNRRNAINVLRLALSRIIVTKNNGASLARDVSHSRPHKVAEVSSFEVMPEFARSINKIRVLLAKTPSAGNADVTLGDSRALTSVGDGEVDAVLTSPPYLNAIDYMRGHRLSLVWLGYRLTELRRIRSTSIGAEHGPDPQQTHHVFEAIKGVMVPEGELSRRHSAMVDQYSMDVFRFMSEIARVLKRTGRATLIVGDCCVKGVFIRNSAGVKRAASLVGLRCWHQVNRDLPARHRYLPTPQDNEGALGKRIRTEAVLSFVPA